MANVLKSVTGYPEMGWKYSTIYTSPINGTGSVIESILNGYSGVNFIQNNLQATLGIKRNNSNIVDIISGSVPSGTSYSGSYGNGVPNSNVISNKLFLNPGDKIVGNCKNNYPMRPLLGIKPLGVDGFAPVFILSNSDGSILIAFQNNKVYKSTNKAETWVYVTTLSGSNYGGMFFKNEFWYYNSLTGGFKSTDGDIWNSFTSTSCNTRGGSYYTRGSMICDNTTAYRINNDTGYVMVSTNGTTWSNFGAQEGGSYYNGLVLTPNFLWTNVNQGGVSTYRYFNRSGGGGSYNNTADDGSVANSSMYQIGNMVFATKSNNISGKANIVYSSDINVNINLFNGDVFIPLKNAFIFRDSVSLVYYLQYLSADGNTLGEKVQLLSDIFTVSGGTIFTRDDSAYVRYITNNNYTLFSDITGVFWESLPTTEAVFGVSTTVSVIETSP